MDNNLTKKILLETELLLQQAKGWLTAENRQMASNRIDGAMACVMSVLESLDGIDAESNTTLNLQQLTKIYADKLAETGDPTAAFRKSHWVAYNTGHFHASGETIGDSAVAETVESKPAEVQKEESDFNKGSYLNGKLASALNAVSDMLHSEPGNYATANQTISEAIDMLVVIQSMVAEAAGAQHHPV